MKNSGKVLLIVISVLFLVGFGGGLAFAQEAAANDVDISSWFVDTITLAGIVGLVVSFIRKHLIPTLDGISVVFVSLGVGAALGLFGAARGFIDGGVFGGLVFGLTAGFGASGGVDFIRGLLGKRKAPAA